MAKTETQNDRDRFAQWMGDHRGIVVKIVRGFTTDPTDADDLTQDITVALWQSMRSYRGDAKVSTWIWRIALNRAISWQRLRRPEQADLERMNEPSATDRADDGVLVDRIYAAIRRLTAIDRSLIMLQLEGYRHTEIADMTGLTETNVATRLSRARSRLSEELEEAR